MKYYALIVAVLLLLLASCGPAPGAAVATPTPAPPALSQTSGTARFRDYLATADQFILQLTGVPTPPGGQAYQGWLLGDDGTMASIGLLNLNPDGSAIVAWNSPNGENLLSRYARFQITLEPAAGNANPTGEVVFAGGLEGEALANARRLFVSNEGEPATPLNTAFAIGLIAQTDLAVQHVQNAVNAAAIGAPAEMRAHLEHVVNILEGATGPRYGDHDGNGIAESPGDGFGVVGYSGQIAELLKDQEAAIAAAADILAQSAAIQDRCLEILKVEDTATSTAPPATSTYHYGQNQGQSVPGTATVPAPLAELAGMADRLQTDPVVRLYQAAQDALRFEVTPLLP